MDTSVVSLERAFSDHLDAGGGADPHALYHRMRAESPAFFTPTGFWFLTSYELATTYFHLDSDKNSAWTKNAALANDSADMSGLTSGDGFSAKFFNNEIHHRDGEDHARLRRLMNKPFSPRSVTEMREPVRSVIEGVCGDLESRTAREADLVADFALKIPTRIVMDLLGIGVEHYDLMVEIAEIVIRSHEPGQSNWAERADVIFERGHELILDMVEDRRRTPRDDLLTRFAALQDEPGPTMTDLELTMNVMFLLVAGHETTANSIGSAIHLMLTHPDQLELMQRDPGLVDAAVEEILRYRPSVRMASPRWALEDIELGGQQIKRGDEVKASILAANRDPVVFADPDTFDIRRTQNRHLSFALGATHYCLGASLARMEIQESLKAVFGRFPGLELSSDEVRYHDSFVVHGPTALPVRW